jgi:hypothetical protein
MRWPPVVNGKTPADLLTDTYLASGLDASLSGLRRGAVVFDAIHKKAGASR